MVHAIFARHKRDSHTITTDEIRANLHIETVPFTYADLPYRQGVVGDTDAKESVHIPSITGTGDWELGEFHDEFGEDTGKKYLLLFGWEEFSNSATTNSRLMASLQVFDDEFSFRLYEYGDITVKGEKFCTFKIKDSNGNVHEMLMYNGDSGLTISFPRGKYDYDMEQILTNGGEIVVVTKMGNYIKSNYRFKMDVSGYEKAKTFL